MIQSSLQIINSTTLQLWEKSMGMNILRPCASSVLVSDGNSYYLITCSHTFSTYDNEEVDFGFMFGNTFYYLDGQRVSAPDTIEQGNCDVSVVKLEEDTFAFLQNNGYCFISQEHLAINHIIEDHQQLYVCGYPANRTKRVYGDDGRPLYLPLSSESSKELIPSVSVFKSEEVNLMMPVTDKDYYYKQLKVEKHLQYVLDFHKDKLYDGKGCRTSLPNPRGMSGCGLWGINQSNGDYYLVGIMTDFGENLPLMVATRIDYATELMRIVLNASFPQSEIVQVKWYRDDSIPYEIKK